MKLAFSILAAVFAATDFKQCKVIIFWRKGQNRIDVCAIQYVLYKFFKEVIKSSEITAANLVSTISSGSCFKNTPNNYPTKACATNGYSLYFQRQG